MQISFQFKAIFGVVGILIAFTCNSAAQELLAPCQSLQESDPPATMLAYLQQDRKGLQYTCITMAMEALGRARYRPAIKTLIGYLDLKEPGVQHVIRAGPTGGLYPAAEALARIGDAVIPHLKEAISNNDNKKIVRTIAASTYLSISTDTVPAVSFVAKAARASLDLDTGDALLHLAEMVAKHCPAKDQQRCEQALNEH